MSQAVLIPWRFGAADDAPRTLNLAAVIAHLNAASFWPIYGVANESDWSPGQARNKLVDAYSGDDDLLVFNDADTICPAAQIREASWLASESPGLVFAYDFYLRLSKLGTELYRESGRTDEVLFNLPRIGSPIFNSGSMGCVAISRACFEEVGGFDERYVGWGYEDIDFATRCADLWPLRRVTGPVFHLWHGDRRADDSPEDSDAEQVKRNELLFQYRSAPEPKTVSLHG